ncbi:mannitol dehydrogenase family protein [Paracoccus aestuariivivens]|uniref:Mannitol dehydrogenase family protein n=1 Tax=Paracoccus aestuariivivens TaxID=1820333 RepID=A0A6L6J3M1_9RHOB|nr:mannitol dehydrogenase family protein [Paracoccus aestuariivivens]MTH76136.1 mannitol dehydrogenase family protein [Paracoccus aestuariivivens]
MSHLSSQSVLPETVATPQFDRATLLPGILHLGFGAFHRAHQAVFTQRALNLDPDAWGIIAVNLRRAEPIRDLEAQDGLYTVITRGHDGDSAEVIGVTENWLCASDDSFAVLGQLADPAIRIVTLTVTEKAYGIDPATGGIDRAHPSIAADLANPQQPTGAVGLLVAGLAARRAADVPPFTVLCCDNLPSNGRVLRRLALEFAAAHDPELADWIATEVSFPSSMVDRIVPAATEATRDRAKALLGVEDPLAIETEQFIQWVIEDDFPLGRPAWDKAGVVFVTDVEPYEKMKLRMLNGTHTLIAHLGILHGLEHVRDVMAVPELVIQARAHMDAARLTLDPVPGIDLDRYAGDLMLRFANPAIAHRNIQIAMDTTQKLPQRIFSPALDALNAGQDVTPFARATGAWIAAIAQRQDVDDPRREELLAAIRAMSADDPVASFLALPGLVPAALADSVAWRQAVNEAIAKLVPPTERTTP